MKKVLAFVFVGLVGFLGMATNGGGDNRAFEISKNIDIFVSTYQELNTYYVDDLNPDTLMRIGIDAMLESVDPYTQFIAAEELEHYQYGLTGRYAGLGVMIHKYNGKFVVVRPYDFGPAFRSGVRAGDVIVAINDKVLKPEDPENATNVLKGPPGTVINLRIRRPGENSDRTIRLYREEIKVPNVPYAVVLENGTAYLALTTFTEDASEHVAQALRDLEKNPSVRNIVLDLRGNGGGLLNEAVNVSNVFLNKDLPVTHLRGRTNDWDKTYKTTQMPVDASKPLAVLIDGNSASASEIVAGAIQDHDRGVVVGDRSFGKGLVQSTFSLSYNTRLRVTSAKYYTPSGRCIQAVRYKNGKPVGIPDSLRSAFRTQNGRLVYDGGGIQPDVSVTGRTLSKLARDVEEKHLIFDFVTQYLLSHPEKPDPATFLVGDPIFEEFVAFARKQNYAFENATDACLKDLEANARQEGVYENMAADLATLRKSYQADRQNDLLRHKEALKYLLGQEIIERHFPQKGKYLFGLRQDPQLAEALRVLNDPSAYQRILSRN